jgi:tRNA dimethylallyltransferase
MYDLISIVGATASGKTAVACALAHRLGTEIISGDSRQVYRGMDIGTGKDLDEYIVENQSIPHHLIDIREAGEKYNIFEFQHDFHQIYSQLRTKSITPVLCGGSGLYIESVLKGFRLLAVPENEDLRQSLKNKSLEELTEILAQYKTLHNNTDVDSAQRAIRAIEIAEYSQHYSPEYQEFPPINSLIIGIDINRDLRREKITKRLRERLDNGMIDEIKGLLEKGIAAENLIYYGLEYKFATQYLIGQLSYNEMFTQLKTAIHQFAKRQMTWFRGMERRGLRIHWIAAELPLNEKVELICEMRDKIYDNTCHSEV